MDKNKATAREIVILVLCVLAFVVSMVVQSMYTVCIYHDGYG
ncbi:MAG: hypothetical protein V3G42_03215 [Oscillospiraceae bacterium]